MTYFLNLVELWKTDGRGSTVESCKFPGNPDYIIYASHFIKGPIATEDQNNTEEPSEQTNAEQMLKGRQQLVRSGGSYGEVRVAATVGLETAQLHCDKPGSCKNQPQRGVRYSGNFNWRFSKWKTLGFPQGKCLLSE